LVDSVKLFYTVGAYKLNPKNIMKFNKIIMIFDDHQHFYVRAL
jgi:hypothetical protein